MFSKIQQWQSWTLWSNVPSACGDIASQVKWREAKVRRVEAGSWCCRKGEWPLQSTKLRQIVCFGFFLKVWRLNAAPLETIWRKSGAPGLDESWILSFRDSFSEVKEVKAARAEERREEQQRSSSNRTVARQSRLVWGWMASRQVFKSKVFQGD